MTNQYDVTAYNDEELLNILGLVSPSDRELEAKLIEMIRRYSFIRTSAGKQLYKFFTDIYDHFFDVPNEGEEDDEEPFEGFTTMAQGTDTKSDTKTDTKTDTKSDTKTGEEVSLIQQLDYTVGKLNPILKETYKRTISIDSQYRDSEYTMSTDFTLNFTETLKDVVSIKLYAIQLPVTWYTINENYGSNFFYLKSNTPGIDTADHEYRIEVGAGNYSPATLQTAIEGSFANLRTIYPDVNFGQTQITYNVTDCKSTITMDIQKVYNEHYYEMHFERPSNEFGSLAKMLGFEDTSYNRLYTVYSGDPNINVLDPENQKSFKIDTTNNKFKIVQYQYTTPSNNSVLYTNSTLSSKNYDKILLEYDDLQGISDDSQIIVSQNYTYEELQAIEIELKPTNQITMTQLLIQVNEVLQLEPKLDSDSGVTYDSHTKQFVWNIKLNRNIPNVNMPNSKTVLIFPYDASWNDTTETTESKQLWVDDSDASYNSGFGFKQTPNTFTDEENPDEENPEAVIELSNIFAENEKTTKFTAQNYQVRFICIDPSFNSQIGDYDASFNNVELPAINPSLDFQFNIDASTNYVQSTLVSAINDKIQNHPDYSDKLFDTNVKLEENRFKFKIKTLRQFDTSHFLTTTTGPIESFGTDFKGDFKFDESIFTTTEESGITTYIYNSLSLFTLKTYTIPAQTLFKIKSGSDASLNDVVFDVKIQDDQIFQTDSSQLAREKMQVFLETTIKNYKYDLSSNHYPLHNSSLTIGTSENRLNVNLNIQVDFEISEKSYRVEFIDPSLRQDTSFKTSTWHTAFDIDLSYNLSEYTIDNSYAEVCGNIIELDELAINETITFKPKQTSNGGVYIEDSSFNDIVVQVNTDGVVETRQQIINRINAQFYDTELTRGSFFQLNKNETNTKSTTRLRLNINKIYTSQDYRLVFFDIYSFVRCNESTRSYQNATIDNTLGWILGFRTLSEYALLDENIYTSSTTNTKFFKNPETLLSTGSIYTYNETFINDMTTTPSNVITTLKGDTTVSVNLYNYFMIILDDFNQNHLNDGLVTVTKRDNSVTLPSYANRKKYTCDPITGEITNTGIPSGQNSLTQNQLYSLNQLISTQNKNRGSVNSGPFIKDMFALLPVKTSGMIPGSIFVEYGGTLQNQERVYFGPVNINRMKIKLINDRGDVVDLNGANWSIQLVCEQLYQKQKST